MAACKRKFKSTFQMTNHDMIPDYLGEFKWDPRFKNHSYSTCVLRLSNCTFYKLHIKNTAYFKSTDVCKKTQLFLKKEKAILLTAKKEAFKLVFLFFVVVVVHITTSIWRTMCFSIF